MSKDYLQIFLNLNLTEADRESVTALLKALEAYLNPRQVLYMRDITLTWPHKVRKRELRNLSIGCEDSQ